jgi:uncharacterized protein with NAD-binding domain and iron-sulfur cluster
MHGTRRKIAILGGGVGAMTAAFELTTTQALRDRHDVTVYQVGWRLGGKGASGRHSGTGARIEEHGLHVWSGFYDNAIRQMKACLKELNEAGAEGVYPDFGSAFLAHNNIVLGDGPGDGWKFWPVRPENNEATPGEGGVLLSPWEYFTELAGYLRDMLDQSPVQPAVEDHPARRLTAELRQRLRRHSVPDRENEAVTPLHALHDYAQRLPRNAASHAAEDTAALRELTRDVHTTIKAHRTALAGHEDAEMLHEVLLALDLGGAALRGMVADGVVTHGFDVIDHEEISHWLAKHGARPETIDSPLVRAVYDYAFGYRRGITDHAHRAIAAGTFLKGSMRLFLTYKGSIFFKMRAGMGDTIFTPYYKALKARGVKFRFFHKVRELKLSNDKKAVELIGIDRQATVLPAEYDPFMRVGNLDCWPSQPHYDQLAEGDDLRTGHIDLESSWTDWEPVERLTLQRGQDFDEVVLGISIGALPAIARDLIATDPAWRHMVEKVETVATQAMQLWLHPDTGSLGWDHGDSILTAYADPMNTWADMTHLDAAETWPAAEKPGSIAYFCGPLADPEHIPPFTDTGFPARAVADVRDKSLRWLNGALDDLWPEAKDATSGSFDQSLLISPEPPAGGDAWASQYFRANFEPTDRYVLSVPGSTTARLRADRSGFRNLWLAGDWTYTGINAGCVEAAAMSGLRAAAGLMGVVPDIVGEEADPVPGGPLNGGGGNPLMGPVLNTIRAQNSEWPWSAVYGMAQTVGPTVMMPFPADTVAAMLPDGLVLAPQDMTPGDQHPVILLFAQQRGVRPNQVPFGMNYTEFICAVPWVRHADHRLSDLPSLICPTKLYLDSLPPILLGIYGYGFPKERAAMEVDTDTYIVRDAKNGKEIISCAFDRTGPKVQAHMLPHFAAARPAYEMAMVTRNRAGQWQYSVYDFSLGQSTLEPLDMEIRISENRFGLPAGILKPPSIATSPFGAVFLTSDATINNPLQSYDLRRVLRERGR